MTAPALLAGTGARAADEVPPVRALQTAEETRVVEFSVPAQSLVTALDRFGSQANVSLVYRTSELAGIQSPGVSGRMETGAALQRLLAGTGVTYHFTGPSTVAFSLADSSGPVTLQPITVSGEKVERSYLDTFTSVGIATGKDIEDYQLDELNQVFETMANVRWFPNNGGNNGFTIRGVNADGVTQPANSAPLISVIIDGATQSAEGLKRGSRGTWDLKQIEVLRGPQSTLQGRNALAGAVIIESNDPTYYPEFLAKGQIGNLERVDVAAALSGPIIEDQVAVRLSGEYRNQDTEVSFVDSLNEPLADDEYYNVRGKVLIEPNALPDLSVLLTASQTYDQPNGVTVTGPDFFDRNFDLASTLTEVRNMNVQNYIADIGYDLSDGFTLRSLFAANRTNLEVTSVPGATFFIRDDNRRDHDYTEDLRLEIYDTGFGLSGVAGIFYGDFNQSVDSYIEASGLVFQDGTFENDTSTTAVYADLRYRFLEDFQLLGGLRFQHDRVQNKIDIDSAFGPTRSDRTTSYNVWLPKLGLAYDIADNQSVAITASRGYRQGQTEVRAGTLDSVHTVDPEFVWTYELAYRLSAFDQRLSFGANAFYNRYRNQQISIIDPVYTPLANTVNAGNSWSIGAEFESRYAFDFGLNVFGSLGFLKTQFGDFDDAACTPSGGSCQGNAFPEAPSYTFSFGGDYQHRSGIFASAWGDYTSGYYAQGDINNNPDFEIDGRFLANARLGYATEHIQASLFVDNLFDKDYLTGRSLVADEATVGDGRLFGIEMRVRF